MSARINYAPFGVASQTGGTVTINNGVPGINGRVANHTGGSATVVDPDGQPASASAQDPILTPAQEETQDLVTKMLLFMGIKYGAHSSAEASRDVRAGETVVINNTYPPTK